MRRCLKLELLSHLSPHGVLLRCSWLNQITELTHIDLCQGYWQVDVAEEDREKTAFATSDGLYQFRRLSFGLTNAPAYFMRTCTVF